MESSVCGSDNLPSLPSDAENANLNEATPAVTPLLASDLLEDTGGMLTTAVERDDAISSTTPDKFTEDLAATTSNLISVEGTSLSSETDADFFTSELSISDVPTEKITENVEDIVQDLENLLGESNDSYRFARESFDSSKLAESYDEVNSSNVADLVQESDLYTLEQSNLDVPSLNCDILSESDVIVTPSGNIETELKETEVNKPDRLEVAEINTVTDVASDLNEIVSESVVLDVSESTKEGTEDEELSTVVDVNVLLESRPETKETNTDVNFPPESVVVEKTNISNEDDAIFQEVEKANISNEDGTIFEAVEKTNISNSEDDTVYQAKVVEEGSITNEDTGSKLEAEVVEEGTTVSEALHINEVCPEVPEICTNTEVPQICKNLEIDQQTSNNLDEIVTVFEQPDENAAELLEKLIKDSNKVDIDSECSENLLDNSNNEDIIKDNSVEEKEQCSVQEENVEKVSEIEVNFSDKPGVTSDLIEDSTSENILAINIESEINKEAEVPSEDVMECSEQEDAQDALENNDKSNLISEPCQVTMNVDVSEDTSVSDVEVQHDPEVQIRHDPEVQIRHDPEVQVEEPANAKSPSPRTSVDEQNVSIRSSTEPLTVEVEDPDFPEQQLAEVTTQEQISEKSILSKEVEKTEIIPQVAESSSDIKQTLRLDTDDKHTNRAPLKMTITKHKSDNVHSILKIYDPNEAESNEEQHIPKLIIKSTPSSTTNDYPEQSEEQVIPKITIKPVLTSTETQHSPRLTIKPIKAPVANQEVSDKQNSPKTSKHGMSGSGSPRITIKPVVKPESLSPLKLTLRPYPKLEEMQSQSSPKLNIKPIVKPETEAETHHSPKITIKPIVKPPEEIQSHSEEKHHSPRITIKPIVKPSEEFVKEEIYSEERHSPRITIKPVIKPPEESIKEEEEKHSPRITIKPIIKPPDETEVKEEKHSPRITIKPVVKPHEESTNQEMSSHSEERQNPKVTIKPIIKPPDESTKEQSYSEEKHSPRITIKPVVKPLEEFTKEEVQSYSEERPSPRITIKPVVKPPEESTKEESQSYPEERQSPRITIKPIIKPLEESIKEEVSSFSEERHSPRITIKPVIKPPEETIKEEGLNYSEERHSPRITIKPVIKPSESEIENVHGPRITIKPVVKPQEDSKQIDDTSVVPVQPFKLNIKPIVKPAECSVNPKVTIKPVPKPSEPESEPIELIDFEDQIKQERIVLKIAKSAKKEKESERLKKIKVKLSKERGLAHIVPTARECFKRSSTDETEQDSKHFKPELLSDLTISLISKTATDVSNVPDVTITRINSGGGSTSKDLQQHLQQEESSTSNIKAVSEQDEVKMSSSIATEDIPDPLADIPVFEITLQSAAAMSSAPSRPPAAVPTAVAGAPPAPRKRGRPRKVPLEVREEFKDPKEEETPPPVVEESTRPKRSCRGASVKATLGIKPRKPRAPSTRGRGGKRTVSTRATTAKKSKERKTSPAKLKQLLKEPIVKEQSEFKEFENKDAEFKQVPLPAESGNREIVIQYEEETRMSAENSSRAQTPAKQVLTSSAEVIEESQSSVQSNTTTESGEKTQKARKGPRLEVHQEPEGEVISADKLAEYSWGGGGPYMLQEQVAQFLGIKSFKRKYPGIQRRPVDMQERDFIRESCLASEAMCDMGLTAVRSEDILDIMYTDFQHKYEEYCKHQRDRQAKDVSNKQKALSLAASQEKTKLDIVEQAVQSAFQWNASFNKARREQRRACMDLQTFTVHFPKGKMKQVNKPPIGHYPLALVPGQYTDYYKKYGPLELGNLPLNSIGCKTISISSVNQDTEESQSDGSGSDSDSSSSDSDSSDSSSGAEDCKMCSPAAATAAPSKKMLVH